MKISNVSALAVLSLFCLVSCKKNNTPPVEPPITPPVIGTMNINLSYGAGTGFFELIISETVGKILLDTLPPFHNSIVAALKTNQTLVDVTLITYDTAGKQYNLRTYKGVNPANWSSVLLSGYDAPIANLSSKGASILYTHVPNGNASYLLLDDYVGTYSSTYDFSIPGQYTLGYQQYSNNNYLYFLLPFSGLYNFHVPKGLTDTVDLSHMDTAVTVSFTKPAQYTLQSCTLVGIMDTTDYNKSVFLYNNGSPSFGIPDVEYPKKLVQKFEMHAYATNTNKGTASYYSYGDAVPSTLPLADESAYTINTSQNNNFSIKFNSSRPTYYYTQWQTGNLLWLIYASPDSTTLNPMGLLTSLKSKSLQGQNFSSLALTRLSFENTLGLDYQGYFPYVTNSDLIKMKRVATSVGFSKTY